MRLRMTGLLLVASAMVAASSVAGPIPPGRQYVMTIEGENTVTFVPQMNMPEFKIDYQAKFEYIVNSRYGKEPKAASTDAADPKKDMDDDDDDPPAKAATKTSSKKTKAKKADNPALRATGGIDVSLHSSQRLFRQNGQAVVDLKVSRNKFQGKAQPEMPMVNVSFKEAPLPLQEIMKGFDIVSATILLNDDLKVVNRKYRNEGPQRAITETMLSLHTPVPRNTDSWEAPTQLVMGHGQTAKGMLRFTKEKPAVIASKDKEKEPAKDKEPVKEKVTTLVKVKVSGTLKAEGVVAGRFIKDGTYNVTGEQTFDTRTNEWINARWSVTVENELANPNGQTVARARGTMIVQSKGLDVSSPTAGPAEAAGSKL